MKKYLVLAFFVSFVCSLTITSADPKYDSATVNTFNNVYSSSGKNSVPQTTNSLDIKKVQSRLKELGYNCGKVDGIIGPNTEAAIKSFQKNKKIAVDGLIGPQTIRALNI